MRVLPPTIRRRVLMPDFMVIKDAADTSSALDSVNRSHNSLNVVIRFVLPNLLSAFQIAVGGLPATQHFAATNAAIGECDPDFPIMQLNTCREIHYAS